MKWKRKKKDEVAPPEAPVDSPEQAKEKTEAIVSDDAPAGAVETVEVPEPGTPGEDLPPESLEADEPSGQDEPAPEKVRLDEEPQATDVELKPERPVDFGIYDGHVVVDRAEFAKLIKQLTYGQPFDPYGIMAMLQKMLHLGSWDQAKKTTETLLKG